MLIYILKTSACLAVFLIFYKLFLENLAIHKFKRIFSLSALIVSVIIPFITFTQYLEPVYDFGTFNPNSAQTPPYFPAEIIIGEQETVNYLPIILWSIYGLGVFVFAIKFIVNLTSIYNRIQQNKKQKSGLFTHVLLQNLIIPHTFFNYIFLNKILFETKQIPQEVFWHEELHAKQKHSLDVLLLEILQVVFWFNPLIYITKNAVKLNHEFLADQAVINKGSSASTYQEILLAFSLNIQEPQLANAINYSSIKKRFTLMKTQTSQKTILLRSLLLLPLLALLVYGFSTKEVEYLEETPQVLMPQEKVNKTNSSTQEELDKANTLKVSYSITDKDNDKAKYYKNVTFTFRDKNKTVLATKTYKELSQEEKGNLPNPPSKRVKKQPSKIEFESWKNNKEFAIWIDNKHIPNSKLNNFTSKDIIYYSGSIVHKNARSEKFPQPNQFHLFTNKSANELFANEIKPLSKDAKVFIVSNKKQEIKVSVKTESILLNGKSISLINLSKELNFITNKWKKEDFELYKLDIKTDNVSNEYIKRINIEYRKSNLAKQSKSEKPYLISEPVKKEIKPSSLLDFILEISKKNTTFYLDQKLISTKKAITIAKNAKQINILTQQIDTDDPIVRLQTIKTSALEEKTKTVNSNKSSNVVIKVSEFNIPPPPIPKNATPEQKIKYQKVIDNYEKKHDKKIHSAKTEKGKNISVVVSNCLEIPSTLKINSSVNALLINCIEEYPKNKLDIYNRWGNLIYTKSPYDNSWQGKKADGEMVTQGTYYRVLNLGNGEKAKSGYLYIKE